MSDVDELYFVNEIVDTVDGIYAWINKQISIFIDPITLPILLLTIYAYSYNKRICKWDSDKHKWILNL